MKPNSGSLELRPATAASGQHTAMEKLLHSWVTVLLKPTGSQNSYSEQVVSAEGSCYEGVCVCVCVACQTQACLVLFPGAPPSSKYSSQLKLNVWAMRWDEIFIRASNLQARVRWRCERRFIDIVPQHYH